MELDARARGKRRGARKGFTEGTLRRERRCRGPGEGDPAATDTSGSLQYGSLTYSQFTSDYYALYTYAAFLFRPPPPPPECITRFDDAPNGNRGIDLRAPIVTIPALGPAGGPGGSLFERFFDSGADGRNFVRFSRCENSGRRKLVLEIGDHLPALSDRQAVIPDRLPALRFPKDFVLIIATVIFIPWELRIKLRINFWSYATIWLLRSCYRCLFSECFSAVIANRRFFVSPWKISMNNYILSFIALLHCK